jgi:hypothetical protein
MKEEADSDDNTPLSPATTPVTAIPDLTEHKPEAPATAQSTQTIFGAGFAGSQSSTFNFSSCHWT